MIADRTAELLGHVQKGIVDPADTALLEHASAQQLVDELRSIYRFTFQERRLGRKWEVALARSFRTELVFSNRRDAICVSCLLVPAYLNCVMLNAEDDVLTGISRMTRLTAWPLQKPKRGLALKSGHGFKLDKTPDGWAIKPMRKRLVRLSEEFLRERGWRFDHLKQFTPVP